jgi:hypothetical protein
MRPRTPIATLLCFAHLSACTNWQATTVPLPELTMAPMASPDLRLTTTSRGRVELLGARVIKDSLVGLRPYPESGRVAVALPDISKVEVQKVSAGRTAALIAIPALVALGVMYANSMSHLCEDIAASLGGTCVE